MKAIWKGSIALALVNIPVKVYSAIAPKEVSFRLLCGKCGTPLKYKRYCPKCKREVVWQEVKHGLEISKGKYIIIDEAKLKKIKPEKTDLIEIIAFLDESQIDPIYYSTPYWVVPEKKHAKAYFLLYQSMQLLAKVALVRWVMSHKEHIGLLKPYKGVLLLRGLHYAYEIKKPAFPELAERIKINKKELELSVQLIKKFIKEEVNLEKFKDTFVTKLKQLILGKIKPKEEVKPKPEKLLKALEASLKIKTKKK